MLIRRRGVAQFGSALEWGSRGRKFDSCHSDHIRAIKKILPTKSPILSDFFHTQKPKFICQKP